MKREPLPSEPIWIDHPQIIMEVDLALPKEGAICLKSYPKKRKWLSLKGLWQRIVTGR